MGKVVSIINLKGGVGKTTLAVCLGEFLGITFRKRTLLIDMDHQTNLTYAMLPREMADKCNGERKTIFHMFESALSGNHWESFFVICVTMPISDRLTPGWVT